MRLTKNFQKVTILLSLHLKMFQFFFNEQSMYITMFADS